ncbi:hypothetical protein OIE68_12750 [Nocardia vinacea]|uniref:hypothetical protein n=1 Tax=Nocardia vinacea TaxID=96468 RepID=UPI002E11467F|nr:hypothetical protein OIE68_12750 [Nocardia vinacea]
MTESVTAAFAASRDVVGQLREQAVAAFYDPHAEHSAAEATARVWSLAGELTGGDLLARCQIYRAALVWGIRQVPAGIGEILSSAPAAPLCETVAALVIAEACVVTEPSDAEQWILARDQAHVLAVDPDATAGFAGEALLFGALACARRRKLAEGAFPRHCALVLWLAAAIYRSRDARWTATELGSRNGWVLTDRNGRVEGPGRRTYHLDLTGAQEYVLAERYATCRRVLASRIAAGQNLEPVTGAYLRYLIAVDTDTHAGIFFVPGEFTEVEYKACAFEALGTNLEPTLHVHSDCQVFYAANVVWQQLAP